MKVKVSEATPLQLNYLVALCEGHALTFFDDYFRRNGLASGKSEARVDSMLEFQPLKGKWARLNAIGGCTEIYGYSTDWSQGGPIIEREKICVSCPSTGDFWDARLHKFPPEYTRGSTPLIAAMRCYVASKLGDVVEIPEELK